MIRKGFTLVELLIVIVVIGILSAMMIFSSTEAVSSAKAAKIIGDMTNLRKATMSWYVDNIDRVKERKSSDGKNKEYKFEIKGKEEVFSDFVNKGGGDEILKYISNGSSIKLQNKKKSEEGDYVLIAMLFSSKWYICYNLGDKSSRLKEKLAGRKSSIGLLGSENVNTNGKNEITEVYKKQKFVCMLILDLGD